jgi:hypothetical protein
MKKLLYLALVAVMVTASGCIVYPGYDGYYDSGYYGGSYGYAGPNVNLYYSNMGDGYRSHHQGYGDYNHGAGFHHHR